MNVYDTANQLAKEVKESEEYQEYKKAKKKIINSQELKEQIDEFEKIRYDVQILSMKGEEKNEEKMQRLQDMYDILIKNEEIKEYFDLEVKFNVMLADINKIIAEAVADVL